MSVRILQGDWREILLLNTYESLIKNKATLLESTEKKTLLLRQVFFFPTKITATYKTGLINKFSLKKKIKG